MWVTMVSVANYVGNHGKRGVYPDLTVHVMVSQKFPVDYLLGMCYDSDFGLEEDESSCDEDEEVHAYCGQ